MKKNVFFAVTVAMAMLISSCGNAPKKTNDATTNQQAVATVTPTNLTFTQLDGYFIKNMVTLNDSVNVLTAANDTAFNKLFGMAKTMKNKIATPDFVNSSIVSIACKSTNVATILTVERVTSSQSGVSIYVKIGKGETQSFSTTPAVIISLPKQAAGTAVSVFEGEHKLASGIL